MSTLDRVRDYAMWVSRLQYVGRASGIRTWHIVSQHMHAHISAHEYTHAAYLPELLALAYLFHIGSQLQWLETCSQSGHRTCQYDSSV